MRNKRIDHQKSKRDVDESGELKKLQSDLQRTKKRPKRYEKLYAETAAERDELRRQRDQLQAQYDCISNSASWRITKPVRRVLDFFKRVSPFRLTGKLIRSLRTNGWRATFHRIRQKLSERKRLKKRYNIDLSKISVEQRVLEECTCFDRSIKFSILVPLYNTPVPFLDEMITSVVEQTYSNWELCLADGSDAGHEDVCRAVLHWKERDPRILYRKLEQNLGISENTHACLEMATGDYIALFDHDDILHPSALFEMMKAICEQHADFVYTDEITFSQKLTNVFNPHYKPDFSPDLLRSYNYICHFVSFSRDLLQKTGGFRSEFDGSQDYDLILRLTECATRIVHIPRILYFWRSHPGSVASDVAAKPYTLTAAKHALREHLERVGLVGMVTDSRIPSTYRIRYALQDTPLVSIIIPNMDHVSVLSQCIHSIEKLSTYRNFEILIVENNSKKESTFSYYDKVCREHSNIRLLKWEQGFNYSKINNFAIQSAKGEYIIFLNNDIKIITPDWIQEMLMFTQRKDVGATGIMLYYPDNSIQHAGVILGIGGIAGHSHKYFRRNEGGYMSRLSIAQNLTAVTAACMMVKASVFREVGGFDEDLAVAFNDVDLCMKIRQAGYLIVFTPYAEAYHYESKSRGLEDTPEKQARFNQEVACFRKKWGAQLEAGDPYYNPNLSLEFEDFRIK